MPAWSPHWSLGALQEEIAAWSCDVNTCQRGVDWRMTIDDARCKLKSVYPEDYGVTEH